MKLLERYGDHWASIDCGHGLTIGLHPASPQNPAGRVGSITIGFRSSEPIRETVATLEARGVVFRGDIVDDTQLLIANFQDPDGNPFYLSELKSESEQRREPQPATSTRS